MDCLSIFNSHSTQMSEASNPTSGITVLLNGVHSQYTYKPVSTPKDFHGFVQDGIQLGGNCWMPPVVNCGRKRSLDAEQEAPGDTKRKRFSGDCLVKLCHLSVSTLMSTEPRDAAELCQDPVEILRSMSLPPPHTVRIPEIDIVCSKDVTTSGRDDCLVNESGMSSFIEGCPLGRPYCGEMLSIASYNMSSEEHQASVAVATRYDHNYMFFYDNVIAEIHGS